MDQEVKDQFEGLNKAFHEFKKTNDELLKAKAEGKGVAELEQKLTKLSEGMDKMQAIQDRVNQMETALKRTANQIESKDGISAEQIEYKKAFARALCKNDDSAIRELEKKTMSVGSDSDGGFLVPEDTTGRIIQRIFETSPIRLYAAIQSITTGSLSGATDYDETTAQMVGEQQTRSTTATPKIGKWNIPVHEMYCQPPITQTLLDDAGLNIENWLTNKVSSKFSRKENQLWVNGSGNGEALGFMNGGTFVEESTVTDDSFASGKKIGYVKTGVNDAFAAAPNGGDVLIDVCYALKDDHRESPNTAWAMHRTTVAKVRKLKDNEGAYLWQPGLQPGQPQRLLSYPIATFQDMPKVGDTNKNAIIFANWMEFYQIVDRMGIRVIRDNLTQKGFILMYTTKRSGGAPLNFEAAKAVNFSA